MNPAMDVETGDVVKGASAMFDASGGGGKGLLGEARDHFGGGPSISTTGGVGGGRRSRAGERGERGEVPLRGSNVGGVGGRGGTRLSLLRGGGVGGGAEM